MTQTLDAPQQTLAKRAPAFEPLAPIGSASALKALLQTQSKGIAETLPKHITPERLIKTMLVAANRIPDLLKCTQASIMETINRAAELGLDLSGTLGEAYPVPFNNKVKDANGREMWVMQCQLIIGYRGMEKLAWQSGMIESIDAEVVYTKDDFKFKKGTTVLVEWTPCMEEDRGKAIGAYACVNMKGGGHLAKFLTVADIEKIRNSAKSKNSPAWGNWWGEMARKCALKRTLKDAPLSTEKFVAAMEHDNADFDLTDVLEAQTQRQLTGAAALNRQIADDTQPSAPASQQTAGTSLPADESTPGGTPRGDPSPAAAATDSSVGSRAAEGEDHQQPEEPEKDEPAKSTRKADADSQTNEGASDEAIDELVSQGEAQFKKALLEKAREVNGTLSKTNFEGGVFKFINQNGKAAEQWRRLWRAVAAGKFDFSKGIAE